MNVVNDEDKRDNNATIFLGVSIIVLIIVVLSILVLPSSQNKEGSRVDYSIIDSIKYNPYTQYKDENGVVFSIHRDTLISMSKSLCIEKYEIPNSVKVIRGEAFLNCHNLKEVIIAPSVKHIGHLAFRGCDSLKKIHLPSSVETMGDNPFVGLETDFWIVGSRYEIQKSCLIDKEKRKIISYVGSIKDKQKDLTDLDVLSIGSQSFACNKYLEGIVLPKSLKTIESFAFRSCENLRMIFLPDSLENIGFNPFAHCYNIADYGIDTKEYVCRFKTNNKHSLVDLSLNKMVCYFARDPTDSVYFDENTEKQIRIIQRGSFSYCKHINKLILPKYLESINSKEFLNTDIDTIKLSENIKTIGSFAFDDKMIILVPFGFSEKIRKMGVINTIIEY